MANRCKTPTCFNWAEPEDEFGLYDYCSLCYDRMIERHKKRQEWDYYHPGEPCPKSELE